MSNRCKAVFERGRFFIETGGGRGFILFWRNSDSIIRNIPGCIFKRIAELVNVGDKDRAVALWYKACQAADKIPLTFWEKSFRAGLYLLEIVGVVVFCGAIIWLIAK